MAAISITLLTVIFLLTVSKSSTFNVKEISRPSTISSNDEKNLKSRGNTVTSIKNSKASVPGKTQDHGRGNTSESLREVHGIGGGKTIEEHLKGFSSMDNDAKINLIINLESFEPDLLNLAFDTDIPKENVKALVMKALSDKDKKVRTQALLSASFLWDQEFSSEDEAIIHLRRE
ncbi:MAG: hypothetical protein NT118_05735 [Lentisphaerae bacterium]|nr:hypothetical protein [Lentisphaerota bacterium]